MANASVLGRNPRVFTAGAQTVPGGLYIARVLWDYSNTLSSGTLILREGDSASPTYICTLRAERATAGAPRSIPLEIHHFYRDVNTLTMTAGTLYVYTSKR